MSAISRKLRKDDHHGLIYYCQGCEQAHRIEVGNGRWTWNGDVENPTFSPSVKVSGRKFTPKGEADYQAWAAAGYPKNADGSMHSFDNAPTVCHTFITNGMVQFLSDCTHELAGQTLPLPDLPEWLQGE
jgi:hypothetical protein